MRTVTYKSVLHGAARILGKDASQLQTVDALILMEFTAQRLKLAREYYRWPEILMIEERWFRPAWEAAVYAAGVEVRHEGVYYISTDATTAEDVPGVSDKWEELETLNRYVDWAQEGETEFDAVLGAWDADPREHADAVRLDFEVAREGVRFGTDAPTSVWLELRERCPDYTWEAEWSAASFAAGVQVYHGDTGEIYRASSAAISTDVPGAAAKWVLIPLPAILADAVKRGAAADWWESQGQPEKAGPLNAKFIDLLDEQVSQLVKLQGQTGRVTRRN